MIELKSCNASDLIVTNQDPGVCVEGTQWQLALDLSRSFDLENIVSLNNLEGNRVHVLFV
jgi:hypothetical protein